MLIIRWQWQCITHCWQPPAGVGPAAQSRYRGGECWGCCGSPGSCYWRFLYRDIQTLHHCHFLQQQISSQSQSGQLQRDFWPSSLIFNLIENLVNNVIIVRNWQALLFQFCSALLSKSKSCYGLFDEISPLVVTLAKEIAEPRKLPVSSLFLQQIEVCLSALSTAVSMGVIGSQPSA